MDSFFWLIERLLRQFLVSHDTIWRLHGAITGGCVKVRTVKKRSQSSLLVPIASASSSYRHRQGIGRKKCTLSYAPRNIWRIRTIHAMSHPSLRQIALVVCWSSFPKLFFSTKSVSGLRHTMPSLLETKGRWCLWKFAVRILRSVMSVVTAHGHRDWQFAFRSGRKDKRESAKKIALLKLARTAWSSPVCVLVSKINEGLDLFSRST